METSKEILHDLKELDYDSISNGASKWSEAGNAAIEAAKEAYETVQNRALEGAKATDRYVRDNPYQSLGIIFGAGLVLGWLLSRD